MTNAELIKALLYCISDNVGDCDLCPYQIDCKSNGTGKDKMIRDAADALEAAEKQIAELMPKEGKWIEQDDGDSIFFKCSVCGKIQYNVLLEMMQGEYHYCPNCGARMRGANDEQIH